MPNDNEGAFVPQAEATEVWAEAAYDALRSEAEHYNRLITYKEIAAHVQKESGITTQQQVHYWIGGLLEAVAVKTKALGEPPLTALCVHQNGTIGEGYRKAPKSVPQDDDADIERLAAEHRLLCYQEFAVDLPDNGGVPTLTPQVAQKRARQRKADPPPRPTCPIHNFELSGTGICSFCE